MRQVFLLGQISSKKENFYAFSKILDIFKLCPSKNIWSQCILMDFKIISYLSFKWIHMQFIKVNVKVKYKKKTELGQNEKYVCSYNYFPNVTFFHNSFSWKKRGIFKHLIPARPNLQQGLSYCLAVSKLLQTDIFNLIIAYCLEQEWQKSKSK